MCLSTNRWRCMYWLRDIIGVIYVIFLQLLVTLIYFAMYIYELPHTERKELCRILDQNKWEELAGNHMRYDVSTIQELRRENCKGCSPTDQLLTMWGCLNHTVLELFCLLGRMHHYQAMTLIKKFVPVQYHMLIKKGEQNPDVLLERLRLQDDNENLNQSEKILNVPKNVLNRERSKEFPVEKEIFVSREENDSVSPVVVDRRTQHRVPSVAEISTVVSSAGAIPQISYEELEKSTNNWDESARLGKGGFGTVYKGIWKCTQVAIKRIEKRDDPESHNIQIKQSITELHCLNAYRHDNILPLYGFSIGGPQPCLVYQYMPGGCLDVRLRTNDRQKLLNWHTRLNIAIGSARGLQYLHTIGAKPLVHGDIKPANILLDPNNNPRIGDFGLAREGPDGHYNYIKVSRIHGTRPYLPDEFLRARKFSTKVDTYSFGVVLFEMATGLPAYSDKKLLRDRILECNSDILTFMDKRVENGEDVFGELMRIGKWCVQQIPKNRPEMVEVLLQLEGTECWKSQNVN